MTRVFDFPKYRFAAAMVAGLVLSLSFHGADAAEFRDTDGVGKHTEVVDMAFAGTALKLTVDSMCRRGKVVFRMKNDGASWPGPARMQVIDADSGEVITGRALKLKSKQSAGFSIRPNNSTETLSLRIEATWLPETYEHAVGQSCR